MKCAHYFVLVASTSAKISSFLSVTDSVNQNAESSDAGIRGLIFLNYSFISIISLFFVVLCLNFFWLLYFLNCLTYKN